VRRFVVGVELDATPRPGRGGAGLDGRRRQGRERGAAAVAMPVARAQDPVVIELGQQLAAREREGRLDLARVEQPVELVEVDADVAAQPDPLAVGPKRGRGDTERAANRR
jgi:hypothetical protein